MLYHLSEYLVYVHDAGPFRLVRYTTFRVIVAMLTAFVLSLIIGRFVINFLYKKKIRDVVRDYSVMSVESKRGTPTMGGVLMFTSILLTVLLWGNFRSSYLYYLLFAMIWFAALGGIDDYLKLRHQDSDRGLSRRTKYAAQIGFGLIFGIFFLASSTTPLPHPAQTSTCRVRWDSENARACRTDADCKTHVGTNPSLRFACQRSRCTPLCLQAPSSVSSASFEPPTRRPSSPPSVSPRPPPASRTPASAPSKQAPAFKPSVRGSSSEVVKTPSPVPSPRLLASHSSEVAPQTLSCRQDDLCLAACGQGAYCAKPWQITTPTQEKINFYPSQLYIPFYKYPLMDLSWLYLIVIILMIIYAANAVNFADGLDGLATVPTMFCFAVYGLYAYILGNAIWSKYLWYPMLPGAGEAAVFCAAVVGACAGFLWFNAYPAEVFMGDTGSLMLGGILGTLMVLLKQEVLFFLLGGIFLAEIVSVMLQDWLGIQVIGRRYFYRAPIHHTFQHRGMAEPKIAVRFWIISAMLALLAISALKIR